MIDTDAQDTEAQDRDAAPANRRRGRPALAMEAREALIFAALENVVAAEGLAGVTMAAVARAARMSKRTLYQVHPSRDSLFAAWVRRLRSALARATPAEAASLPLADRLRLILRRQTRAEDSARRLMILRALIAEGPRHPDLARAFLREGPDSARAIVLAELEQAVARGEIALDDPAAAAALLFDMANPNPIDRLVDPDAAPACDEAAEARLGLAIAVFLDGVAVAPSRPTAR